MNLESLQVHNQAVYSSLEKGNIVQFRRGFYNHFGIYDGHGKIIHLEKDKNGRGKVRKDDFYTVCGNSKAEKKNYLDHKYQPLNKEEIVAFAESKIGEKHYHLLRNNCEQFATLCRYRIHYSQQSEIGVILFMALIFIIGIVFGYQLWKEEKEYSIVDLQDRFHQSFGSLLSAHCC